MQDARWLRVITVGLFLASLAVAYFLLTGQLTSKSLVKTQSQIVKASPIASSQPQPISTISPSPSPAPSPSPMSAFDKIAQRNQDNLQTLPRTGVPLYGLVILFLAVMVFGLSLRRFPN